MRRVWSITMLALLLVGGQSAAAETYEWPQWMGPNRDGLTDETGLLQEWPEGGPQRVWMFENCGSGYSSFSVIDGVLYTMGSREGTCLLLAIDADTGEEIWSTPIDPEFENDWGNGPRSTPTISDNYIYAIGGQGTLICAKRSDGSEVWRVTMQEFGGSTPYWGYSDSVLVDGAHVLCTPGGEQGAIVALAAASGAIHWQATELDDEAHYSSVIRADFFGQPQYVQLFPQRLVSVSATDGSLLWETGWPEPTATIPTPLVHGDSVYITSGYGAGCKLVDIGDGNEVTVVYENKLMKNQHGGVVRLGDYVYGYSDSIGWMCMDFATGDEQWSEREALGKGAIAYADDRLICVSEDEGIVALIAASPNGWEEHGRFTLDPQTEIRSSRGKVWTHPVVVNGKLYLRDQDLLYCYDVEE